MSESDVCEVRIPMPWGYVAGCWYGSRKQRPLLALHGWMDNAGTFATLAPLIARHVPVLAIDLPGHGRSTNLPAGVLYDVEYYIRAINKIIHYFKWQRVALLAHSLSASMCFRYATLYPKQTHMVIALDVFLMRFYTPKQQIIAMRKAIENHLIVTQRLEDVERNPNLEPITRTIEELEKHLHKSSGGSLLVENSKYLLERAITRSIKNPNKYYLTYDGRNKQQYTEIFPIDIQLAMAECIKNIDYMVIHTRDSKEFQITYKPEIMARLLKNNPTMEVHTLDNVTHHFHLNNPNLTYELIKPFLDKYWIADDISVDLVDKVLAPKATAKL